MPAPRHSSRRSTRRPLAETGETLALAPSPQRPQSQSTVLVGVDVGATTISGGLVTPDGEILSVVSSRTHVEGPGTAVKTLLGVVDELVSQATDRGVGLRGVGIGLPGLVDAEKGMMVGSVNLAPEFAHVPLAEQIRATTHAPAFVDNDVNALALAELMFGLGRGADCLVLLAIGTGMGGGIVLDGTLLRGKGGYGGELGHIPVKFDGRPCIGDCHGCMCAYISGEAIAREARERVARRAESGLLALAGGDVQAITAEHVFTAAAAGDETAGTIVDEACEALAAGLGGIVNALNPDLVVVTGGVATSLVPLQADILRRAARYALAPVLASTRIHVVSSDKRHTVRGGAALVLYELARRERSRV